MSSALPVSFHQPSTSTGATVLPLSMSRWMASVIWYSPFAPGSSPSIASWMLASKT